MTIDELVASIWSEGPPADEATFAWAELRYQCRVPSTLRAIFSRHNGGGVKLELREHGLLIHALLPIQPNSDGPENWDLLHQFPPGVFPFAQGERIPGLRGFEVGVADDERIWLMDGVGKCDPLEGDVRFDQFFDELQLYEEPARTDYDLYLAARTDIEQGEYELARQKLEQSWLLHPNPATAHHLSQILLSSGNPVAALDWSRRAVELHGTHSAYLTQHARCLHETGATKEALGLLERILTMNGDFGPAQRLFVQLGGPPIVRWENELLP